VLDIVQNAHVDILGRDRRHEGSDRAVAAPLDRDLPTMVRERHRDRVGTVDRRVRTHAEQREPAPPLGVGRGRMGATDRQVLVLEGRPQRFRCDLAAPDIGPLLDDTAELDLKPARQLKVVIALEEVGTPPLPDWLLTRTTAS